jgi:hypothetical protein
MPNIPDKEDERIAFTANLIDVSIAHVGPWGLPPATLADLQQVHLKHKTLFDKCYKVPHTTVDTEAKNAADAVATEKLRAFIAGHLQHNSLIDDAGHRALGIPIHDTTPTEPTDPAEIPEVEVSTPAPRTARVKFRGKGKRWCGKPDDAKAIELMYAILDHFPTSLDELIRMERETSRPFELVFDENQRGKKLYFVVRWENGPRHKGPWSEIFMVIIP